MNLKSIIPDHIYASINENNDTIILDLDKLLLNVNFHNIVTFKLSLDDINDDAYNYIKEHYYINGSRFELILNDNNIEISMENIGDSVDKIFVIHCDEFNPEYEFQLSGTITWVDKISGDDNLTDVSTFKNYNDDTIVDGQGIYINIEHLSTTSNLNSYNNIGCDNISKNAAFSLLRTNPKLTGNIKLVVSDDTLYLDTFKYKTAAALSNIKYCHKLTSNTGDYASDIFRIFGQLDSTTLMDVNSSCYNGTKAYSSNDDAYNTTYEYGCSSNTNNLYTESFKLLAPLHIGTNMPDYFIIFANPVNNTIQSDNISDIKSLTKTGRIVKIFNLKNTSNVGSYIRSYANKLNNYSLHNIYYAGYKKQWLLHSDTIFGIDYKYGTFATKYNKTPDKLLSIETLNTYYIDSFKNNNLIYPWILNLEFMFNDAVGTDFTVYNYYGFYVTENEYQHITKVINANNSISKTQQYYDSYNNLIDIKSILNNSVNKYDNALFNVSNSFDCSILKSNQDFYNFIKTNVINKAGTLIDSPRVSSMKFNNISSFITIKFDQLIKAGEHFRIITYNPGKASEGSTVYDIIASNDHSLRRYITPISQYVVTNKIKNCNVYSICFYVNDTENINELASLSEQLRRITECIKTIDAFFSVQYNSNDSLSITSLEEHVIFQHILSPSDNDLEYDYIHYFNCKKDTSVVNIKSFNERYYLPYNNPIYDTNDIRYSSMVKFIETKSFDNYQLYEFKDEIDEEINNANTPVYLTIDGIYKPLSNINIIDNKMLAEYDDIDDSYIIPESTYVFVSPFTKNKHFIALSETPLITNNSQLHIYNAMECDLNILSFLNVKDFDFLIDDPRTNTYETSNKLTFESNTVIPDDNTILKKYVLYKIEKGGFYNININPGNVFFIGYNHYVYYQANKKGSTTTLSYKLLNNHFVTNNETIISVADQLSTDMYSYKNKQPGMKSDKLFKSYGTTISLTKNPLIKQELITPIVPATVCNWEITGSSIDNNTIICSGDYNEYDLTNINGTFFDTGVMPDLLSPDDKILYGGEITTVRNLIYNHPEQLRILYKDVPTAMGYYNKTTYSIDFTYNNMLFNISLIDETNNISIADYILTNSFNNIEVAIINDYNANLSNEIFISESPKFILIVNHNYFTYADYKGSNNIKVQSTTNIYNVDYFWTKTAFHYSLIDAYATDTIYKFPVIFNNNSYNKMDDIVNNQLDLYNAYKPNYIQIGYSLYENGVTSTEPCIYYQTVYSSDNISYNEHTGYYADCKICRSILGDDLYIKDNIRTYELQRTQQSSLYEYFNKANNYNSNNISSINNTNLNDGITDYDVISKYDNRNYMSYIISMPLKKSEGHTVNDIVNWVNSIYNIPMVGYVINSNGYKTIESDNISINITAPNDGNKFPNFFIKPSFIDRITFTSNKEISNSLNIDLTNSGVLLNNINHINAYAKNVISSVNKTTKTSSKNFMFINKNIINNTWFSNMFNNKSYTADNISNLKSFYGSCCINIPNSSLNINITNSTNDSLLNQTTNTTSLTSSINNSTNSNKKTYTYKVNLTNAFVNHILGLLSFNSNWLLLTLKSNKSALTNALLTSFIKSYILPYYNLINATPTVTGHIMNVINSPIIVKLVNETNISTIDDTNTLVIDNNKVSISKASNGDIMMEITFTVNKPAFIEINVSIPKI